MRSKRDDQPRQPRRTRSVYEDYATAKPRDEWRQLGTIERETGEWSPAADDSWDPTGRYRLRGWMPLGEFLKGERF